MIQIRKTSVEEIEQVLHLYDEARQIMRLDGNMQQWANGYPNRMAVERDIQKGNSYVCTDEKGNIIGSFAFIVGEDPTYERIYQGKWLENSKPYGVIHRLASTIQSKGVSKACIDWCFDHTKNLRVDTHRDNRIMQHVLLRNGFVYCGIIYLLNGDERLAFQKC